MGLKKIEIEFLALMKFEIIKDTYTSIYCAVHEDRSMY